MTKTERERQRGRECRLDHTEPAFSLVLCVARRYCSNGDGERRGGNEGFLFRYVNSRPRSLKVWKNTGDLGNNND